MDARGHFDIRAVGPARQVGDLAEPVAVLVLEDDVGPPLELQPVERRLELEHQAVDRRRERQHVALDAVTDVAIARELLGHPVARGLRGLTGACSPSDITIHPCGRWVQPQGRAAAGTPDHTRVCRPSAEARIPRRRVSRSDRGS